MITQAEAEQVVAFWRTEVRQERRVNENRRLLLEVLDKGMMTQEQRLAVDDAVLRLGF